MNPSIKRLDPHHSYCQHGTIQYSLMHFYTTFTLAMPVTIKAKDILFVNQQRSSRVQQCKASGRNSNNGQFTVTKLTHSSPLVMQKKKFFFYRVFFFLQKKKNMFKKTQNFFFFFFWVALLFTTNNTIGTEQSTACDRQVPGRMVWIKPRSLYLQRQCSFFNCNFLSSFKSLREECLLYTVGLKSQKIKAKKR